MSQLLPNYDTGHFLQLHIDSEQLNINVNMWGKSGSFEQKLSLENVTLNKVFMFELLDQFYSEYQTNPLTNQPTDPPISQTTDPPADTSTDSLVN